MQSVENHFRVYDDDGDEEVLRFNVQGEYLYASNLTLGQHMELHLNRIPVVEIMSSPYAHIKDVYPAAFDFNRLHDCIYTCDDKSIVLLIFSDGVLPVQVKEQTDAMIDDQKSCVVVDEMNVSKAQPSLRIRPDRVTPEEHKSNPAFTEIGYSGQRKPKLKRMDYVHGYRNIPYRSSVNIPMEDVQRDVFHDDNEIMDSRYDHRPNKRAKV